MQQILLAYLHYKEYYYRRLLETAPGKTNFTTSKTINITMQKWNTSRLAK